jgi:hypothetical protein
MSTPRGAVNGLSPTRESAGVMEKWSSGVMQRFSNVESWGWLCPTLQYSNTPKSLVIFTGKNPLKPDLVQRSRLSMLK